MAGVVSEPLDELRVQQVDLLNQTIELNPGATPKNKEARVIQDDTEVHAVISMCVEGKGPDEGYSHGKTASSSATFEKLGTRCAAMLGSAGWRVAPVIEL